MSYFLCNPCILLEGFKNNILEGESLALLLKGLQGTKRIENWNCEASAPGASVTEVCYVSLKNKGDCAVNCSVKSLSYYRFRGLQKT